MTGKVLITGASGFVGYHLIEAAQEAGLTPVAAVRKSSDVSHLAHFANLEYAYLDFTSVEKLTETIKASGADYIIHSAGTTKAANEQEYITVNADYTRNLAEAAKAAGVKKFVLLSSLAALGPLPDTTSPPITEDKKMEPVTAYGRSKVLAEKYLTEVSGLNTVVLRPTAVYGPRDKDIFIMFQTLSKGFEPYIGRGAQTLSFVYGPDLARVAVQALASDVTGIFNISDNGSGYSRYDLAKFGKQAMHRKTLKVHVPVGIVRIIAGILEKRAARKKTTTPLNREKLAELTAPGWQCSNAKAVKELGFAPKYDLEKGVDETVKWYKQNGWLK